jgi:hypothetical protein
MVDAAHPQPVEDEPAADAGELVKNPFPASMTVPGPDGKPATVELAVVDGIVYAPMLDHLELTPPVKQYVAQYCAVWSSSVVTDAKLQAQWSATPPRRAQIPFREAQLHAMLGLADDERLVRIDVDQLKGEVRFVVESPRLPPMPYWDGGPPIISVPVAAWYEDRQR